MNVIPPLLRRLVISAVLPVLLLSGCGKKTAPETGTPAGASAPASSTATPAAQTTAAAEPTTAPQPVPETAHFFSERFLPPEQRLQRRQERILQVLETATTAPAPQP